METTSTWEFEGICNTPERQEAADRKWQREKEAQIRKNRERQQEAREQGRRQRVEITAVRTGIVASALLILGIYFLCGGIGWLGGGLLACGAAGACVSAYGAGICREMDRK
jgi:hypothetical protein